MTDGLGDAVENLAVVHLQRHADIQRLEHPLDDLHQLHLAQQRPGADHIDIALVEFAIASLLRTVGPPYGLNLVTLERESDLVLVLHDVAGERDGQVVAQPLLAHLRGVTHLFVGQSGGVVARIQDLEKQFVSLVAVLAQQGGEVLHRGGLQRRESEGAEDRPNPVENVLATHHLQRGEVARTFGYGWFLCHYCLCH